MGAAKRPRIRGGGCNPADRTALLLPPQWRAHGRALPTSTGSASMDRDDSSRGACLVAHRRRGQHRACCRWRARGRTVLDLVAAADGEHCRLLDPGRNLHRPRGYGCSSALLPFIVAWVELSALHTFPRTVLAHLLAA